MFQKNLNLNIILPTFNEEKNIEFLIPDIINHFHNKSFTNYEITVVDDGSKDDTVEKVNNLIVKHDNVKLIQRQKPSSLPLSIYDGIIDTEKEYIMWLDADGSMDIDSIDKIISVFCNNNKAVYIGSRFINGGGYKGKNEEKNNNGNSIFSLVKNSEDSLIAIFMSLIFNKILNKVLNIGVTDLTSGFIVGKKSYFNKSMFTNCTYGEYFIKVSVKLFLAKVEIKEVGYYCKPRVYGVSKTSSNLFRLISLSKPYFLTATSLRREVREHLRQEQ